ncbi:MAG: energy-coupling factor transporter transmembrane component T family protein [bacterium]
MGFLNDITLGQYYPGNSILHQLDPRSKLISSLFFMTSLLLSNKLSLILLLGGMCIFSIYFAKLPVKIISKNLKPFFWLFLITFIIHLLTTKGKTIFGVPFLDLKITEQGLINGATYSIRLAFLIIFAALLTLTTAPIELTDSLERLFSPLKRFNIPVHEFTLMMSLSLRFIPILIQEAERIKNAQLSRGASLEGSLLQRVKNIIPMILPLFISAFRRAEELAVAMEARHYISGEGRTSYRQLVFKRGDFGLLIFSGAFLGGILLFR